MVYEYLRNDVPGANSFESNRAGLSRTSLKWNQPVFEIDDPLVIPKVYNGRNRTFFMYSYEIIRSKLARQRIAFAQGREQNWSSHRHRYGIPAANFSLSL